jgi:hypothetical protein
MSLLVTSEKTRVLAAVRPLQGAHHPSTSRKQSRKRHWSLLSHVKRLWSHSSRFPLTSETISSVVSVPTWPEVRFGSGEFVAGNIRPVSRGGRPLEDLAPESLSPFLRQQPGLSSPWNELAEH